MNRIIAAVVVASIAFGAADAFAKASKGNVVTSGSNAASINHIAVKSRVHPSAAVKKAVNDALHECSDCLQGSGD